MFCAPSCFAPSCFVQSPSWLVPGSTDNVRFEVGVDGLLNTASTNTSDPLGRAVQNLADTLADPGVPGLSSATPVRAPRQSSPVAPKARPSPLARTTPDPRPGPCPGLRPETVLSAKDEASAKAGGGATDGGGGGETAKAPPVTVLLDPFAPRRSRMNGMEIHFHFIDPTVRARLAAHPDRRALCPPDASVCVPTVTPLEVHIQAGDVSHWPVVSVVDPTRVYGIRLDRRPCVQVANRLVLTDGIVREYGVDKPSEMAGCLTIPLDIVSTIISAPFAALRRQTAILDAERARIQAELNLLGTQSQLFRAREADPLE